MSNFKWADAPEWTLSDILELVGDADPDSVTLSGIADYNAVSDYDEPAYVGHSIEIVWVPRD